MSKSQRSLLIDPQEVIFLMDKLKSKINYYLLLISNHGLFTLKVSNMTCVDNRISVVYFIPNSRVLSF